MKAKVIAPTTIYGKPVELGSVHEVDENTFRNLAKKGRLEAADKDAAKVDLEAPSVLSQEQAEKQIEAANEAREAKKASDEAKKKAQNK